MARGKTDLHLLRAGGAVGTGRRKSSVLARLRSVESVGVVQLLPKFGHIGGGCTVKCNTGAGGMSGIKPHALAEFYRALHGRAVKTDDLAEVLDVAPSTVRKLFCGLKPRRGPVWRALWDLLRPDEQRLLASVEQCSAWKHRQEAKRPKMTPEKAEMLSA